MSDNTEPATRLILPWTSTLPYPVRNMVRRWRGALGMMIGVGIALGLGMTFLAVNKASMDLFTGDYLVSGANLYAVTEGGTLIALLPGDTPGTITHARNVLSQIRGMGDVNEALGVFTWSLEREQDSVRRGFAPAELIVTVGVDGNPGLIPNALLMKEGRWVRRPNEIVLGTSLSREKDLGIGDILRLNGRDFIVVGIGRLRGIGYTSNSFAYMDYRALRQRADVGDVVSFVMVGARRPEVVQPRIKALASLEVFRPEDLVAQAEQANATGAALRWIFNILTLSIAGLFVTNMLARSVAERRLEFATLRAIGIPQRTIFMTVGAEALLVSVVAGVFGVLLSLAFGLLINGVVAPEYGIESLYSLDAGLFGIIIALALGLGLVAGLFPARQATRVDPVIILREA